MSFATDGFDGSASPAVCRRVPGIRPKRKFLALSNLKGIEWNSLWLAEVSAAVLSIFPERTSALARAAAAAVQFLFHFAGRADWAITGLSAVSDNCS